MNDRPEYLEGKEFIFKYGRLRLLPLDQLHKDEFGGTIASEQKAYRRERVVRCRDCRHGEPMPLSFSARLVCARLDDMSVEPDGFCAWGEPREGE